MKKIIFLFISLICLNIFPYEKIVLWDSNELTGAKLLFDGKKIYIDNKEININDISFINLNMTEIKDNKNEQELNKADSEELIKRALIMEKKYPDASILVLLDDGIQKLNKDGTQYSRSRYSIKIMNEKSLEEAILTFYLVKGKYDVNIITARSISPDGKITYLSKSDISLTTPKQGLDFFSGKKDAFIMRAVIPNVKVGTIIDYEYEINEPSPEDKNQFYTNWSFGSINPVYESMIKFIVPEDKEFYWVVKNFGEANDKPQINNKDGYKEIYFKRGECPPFVQEPDCPPKEDLMPFVFGSVFKDQTYLSNWLSKLMVERMTANDKMKETVNQLITKNNAVSEEQKLAVIYRFVQEYIHYRSIKTSLSSGFSGHPAAETFENRYGDCIDKAILFATLLKLVNIEAYPVIVMTNDNPRSLYQEIGQISGNHAINEIHLKEKEKKIIYLDSTSTTYRYPSFRLDDQGIPVWNPVLNRVSEIDFIDPAINTNIFDKEIVLTPDGNAEITSFAVYSGDWEAGLREYFMSLQQKELESVLVSIASRDFPGSVLKGYELGNPLDYSNNLYLKYNFSGKNVAQKANDFLILKLKFNFDFENVILKTRQYPLVFQTTEGIRHIYKIKIPAGYKITALPAPLEIKDKNFTYKGKWTLKNDLIIYEDHYIRSGCKISASDYIDYRKNVLKLDNYVKTPIIFEKM